MMGVGVKQYDIDAAAEDDPRAAFVYQEALRGLLRQQAAVQSLQTRAATLIFAASFASSLLGSQALADGVGAGTGSHSGCCSRSGPWRCFCSGRTTT
jgi:hypothetical protein